MIKTAWHSATELHERTFFEISSNIIIDYKCFNLVNVIIKYHIK